MIERTRSGRDDLVEEYERDLKIMGGLERMVREGCFIATSSTQGSVLQMKVWGTSFTASRMRSVQPWNSSQECGGRAKSSRGETR